MINTQPSIAFRGFDERADVKIYEHGLLPHWQQADCTYFVTMRQADSIPQRVVREIEYERKQWLTKRGVNPNDSTWAEQLSQLPVQEQDTYRKLVGKLINVHLDNGYGSCQLRHSDVADDVANAITFFHEKRCLVGDFVVMPNHVHILMTPLSGFELHEILHSIKSYSANRVNRITGGEGAFWQRQSYDHIVRDFEQLEAFQRYIEANPKKANLKPGDYIHCQAKYVPKE